MKPPGYRVRELPAETRLKAIGVGPDRNDRLQIILLGTNGERIGMSPRAAYGMMLRVCQLLKLPAFTEQMN